MAEVTRRVIIEVETRQKKSRLDAPDVGSAERAFKAEADSANKAVAATEKATSAAKRHVDVWATGLRTVSAAFREQQAGQQAWQRGLAQLAEQSKKHLGESTRPVEELGETTTRSTQSMVRDFREAGEGVLRFSRGLALLSANGSDDLKALVQKVAIAQGAFDVFAGGAKALTHISRAFGPIGVGISVVTGALGLGVAAWRRWGDAADKATKEATEALREHNAEQEKFSRFRIEQEQDRRSGLADLAIRVASPERRRELIASELAREQQNAAAFGAELRDLDAATSKKRGARFGETSPELKELLDRFGSFAEIRKQRSSILDRQEESVRRQIDLQEQQKDAQLEQLREQKSLADKFIGAVGLGGSAASNATAAFEEFAGRELKTRFDKTFKPLLDSLEEVTRRQIDIKNLINQSPK
jgi:hypothetical protein